MLIDASFREESRRPLFLDAARRWGITARLLPCQADAAVVRRRLGHRRDGPSDAGWAIHQQAARRWQLLGGPTRSVTRVLDADRSQSQPLVQAVVAPREAGLLGSPSTPSAQWNPTRDASGARALASEIKLVTRPPRSDNRAARAKRRT